MPRAGVGSWPPVNYERIDFKGGLDQLTPTLNLPPGYVRQAQNFMISITGGYTRIYGYERFDGHTSPSAESYKAIQISAFGNIVQFTVITGQSSGTTATVGYTNIVNGQKLVSFTITGGPGFSNGENVQVSGVTQGTVVSNLPLISDAYTLALFTDGAADVQRQNISAVPGSGSVLGVFYLNGTVYAFRNNVGGTIANLYASSGSGWTQVQYGYMLSYNTGVTTPTFVAGGTVTGHTSGATAVIAATNSSGPTVINQTGTVIQGTPTWAGSAGYFIASSTSGVFQAGEALYYGGVQVATFGGSTGALTQIAPAPSGRYVIDVAAFGGGTSTANVAYGASGVDYGFSFDGTVYVPILTGSNPDKPTIARKHLNYLCFAFANSLQISGLGLPYQWTPLAGGAEILLPENITNIMPLPGNQATGALGLFSLNYTHILYGSSTATFQLVPYNIKAGAFFNTATNLADIYFFETRGISNLTTTLYYGNFEPSYLTLPNKPFVDAHQASTTCATVDRENSQYRVFFSDGYGLYATLLNKQYAGCMPVVFPNPVLCVCDGADPSTTQQRIFFGSSNGFVYEMERGTSFDGTQIQAYLQFVYDSMKTHRMLKRFRKMSLEISGSLYCQFSVSWTLGYGQTTYGQPGTTNYTLPFTQAFWDSMTWDAFTWDGTNLAPSEIEVQGTAENIAFYLLSQSDLLQPFTINTATVHYTMRRGLR